MGSMSGIALGVNIDHVATIRQARGTRYPDPVEAARLAEGAGADSITVHLREDRRHIQERDVLLLKEVVQTRLNLEMAVTSEMLAFACRILPQDCCLVPEKRQELTTEGGLNVVDNIATIREACKRLSGAGVRAALFIDPDPGQVEASAEAGAPVVELHAGTYADASGSKQGEELHRLTQAAAQAARLGLEVHAGHGLHYHNVNAVASIREVVELNIGHAIIARAIITGLGPAVSDMKKLMREARP